MKAERRHELKENDLLHFLQEVREYFEEKGQTIALVIIVIIAIFAVSMIVRNASARSAADAWEQMAKLQFPTDNLDGSKASLTKLNVLIENAPNETFERQALLQMGQRAVFLALNAGDDIDTGLLGEADSAFQRLLDRFGAKNRFDFAVAHLGMAGVAENRFAVDANPSHKDEARTHLNAVKDRDDLAVTPFYRIATGRLAELDKVFTKVTFAPPLPKPEKPATNANEGGSSILQSANPPVKIDVSPPMPAPAQADDQGKPADDKGEAPTGDAKKAEGGGSGESEPADQPENDKPVFPQANP